MSGGGGSGTSDYSSNPTGVPDTRSGGTGSGGGPGGGTGFDCSGLQFDARLRNVDADELALVSAGEVLEVIHQGAPSVIGVYRVIGPGAFGATPVGVLSERLGELLPCLEQIAFVAEVLDIDGGNTRVRVRPKWA